MYISPILAFHLGQFSTSMIFLMGVRVADRMKPQITGRCTLLDLQLLRDPPRSAFCAVDVASQLMRGSLEEWVDGSMGMLVKTESSSVRETPKRENRFQKLKNNRIFCI